VHRAAPNFFLVGAPQAGTTSLYAVLDQHPSVFMCPIKEPCFFAPEVADVTPRARQLYDADAAALRRYLDGPLTTKRAHGLVLDWDDYRSLFRHLRGETAIGEASVAYLASPAAAAAIRARLPDARIVMMLRNPVDRLFSRYLAARSHGERDAFRGWLARIGAEDAARSTPGGSIWPGRYAVHLRRFLDVFPEERVRVFVYDDYVRAPRETLRELFAFLDVDPHVPVDVSERHNVTLAPRWPRLHQRVRPVARAAARMMSGPVLDRMRSWYLAPRQSVPTREERAAGIDVYRDDIRELESLLGRDLSSWLGE